MNFSYDFLLAKSPCFGLIKDLRYQNDDSNLPILKGELIAIASRIEYLKSIIPLISYNFLTINQLKRYLFQRGKFSIEHNGNMSELLDKIDQSDVLEKKGFYENGMEINEVIKRLKNEKWLRDSELFYDTSDAFYTYKNQLRDYHVFNETYVIRFFGGNDLNKIYDFIVEYIQEQLMIGKELYLLIEEIKFDFVEGMDRFVGGENIKGYDCFVYLVDRLISDDIPFVSEKITEIIDLITYEIKIPD